MTVSAVASVNPVDRLQELQGQARVNKSKAQASETKAASQPKEDTVQFSAAATAALHGPDADGR